METSTFLPFPRLPYELRMKIWHLNLAPRTIEETWNNSKFQWELKFPSALHAACDVRDMFRDIYSRVALNFGKKTEGDKLVDDIRPFYFSKLDTIYVRREFHFDKTVFSKCLVFLQMDWGMEPYWWLGSQQEGPALLRQFPCLEVFTLVVRTSKTSHRDQDVEVMERAKEYTRRVINIEREQYIEWRVPRIKFELKQDLVDWNIYSSGESPA